LSLPRDLLKKIKLLEISTRKLVNTTFAGEYNSAFKGQGMTFSEFREYIPGDDIRSISWPVTARAGKPYIKIFDEEREKTVLLVVDISGSSDFGTKTYYKGEVLNHLAAIISYTATKKNDPVGLLLFSDQVELYIPPKKGAGHIHRLMRELYYFKPKSQGTSISSAMEHILAVLKKRAHIFIFSDFRDENFEHSLRIVGKKHDAVAVVVEDAGEKKIPDMGLIDFHDAETGEMITIDTSSTRFQKDYQARIQKRWENREQMLRKSQVDRVDIEVGEDFVKPLLNFFRRRNGR